MEPITLPETANRLRQAVEERKRFVAYELHKMKVDDKGTPFESMTLTELEPIYIRECCMRGKEIQ
ncbi:hypothetical protein KO561_05190 [Radiobacillus kanasensis]|uniref:hypothetical protein n=1 Tax=Radiobacillus kanasensis TaxID=2844358 RepID=UPI001E3EC944|nr:hypothetical protein [Radiobacillus kanasensis]UFU00345.1 hypothetical protein KO561_05190 [Radiobacillus kanasensis]